MTCECSPKLECPPNVLWLYSKYKNLCTWAYYQTRRPSEFSCLSVLARQNWRGSLPLLLEMLSHWNSLRHPRRPFSAVTEDVDWRWRNDWARKCCCRRRLPTPKANSLWNRWVRPNYKIYDNVKWGNLKTRSTGMREYAAMLRSLLHCRLPQIIWNTIYFQTK